MLRRKDPATLTLQQSNLHSSKTQLQIACLFARQISQLTMQTPSNWTVTGDVGYVCVVIPILFLMLPSIFGSISNAMSDSTMSVLNNALSLNMLVPPRQVRSHISRAQMA